MAEIELMPRLNSASLITKEQVAGNKDENNDNYLTEANNEKTETTKINEWGTFVWPNGSKYEGEFFNNARNGRGKQTWSDGSCYTGDFVNDLRHGFGSISWSNGEIYEGEFFKDRRHGKGTYKWPNGSVFKGTFYMDKKEGYGNFRFFNGDIFQGLYKEDEREGPGVVTYSNGQQDVGLWLGEKLIKICSSIKDTFSLKSLAETDYKGEEVVTYLDTNLDYHPFSVIENILHPIPALDYPPKTDLSQRIDELYSEVLDYRSLAVNRQAFNEAYFNSFPDCPEVTEKVVAWNLTPRLIALQKHVNRNMCGATESGFDVEAVIRMDRGIFKPEGPLEMQSRELIVAAGSGDARKVELLLSSGKVNPDVSDRNGHTALIGATVNWHIDVINLLLNHGADVNKLNDEGCSALAAGTIFYYTSESFIYNIAETYMSQVQDNLISNYQQETQPKSNTGNERERRASRINQINRMRSKSVSSAITKSVSIAEPTAENDKSLPQNMSAMNQVIGVKSTSGDNEEDADSAYGGDFEGQLEDFVDNLEPAYNPDPEDFDSNQSVENYRIEVSEQLVERCATQLSQNERIRSREVSEVGDGKARQLAIQIRHNEKMKDTLDLLLRRGADPNASSVPMPVLFFAIKSADVEMVKQFLMKGARPNTRLSKALGGLCPLHIACAIPGEEGVEMTELLLDALADPDARAYEDDSFLNRALEDEWSKDPISEEAKKLLGGRTALQIACARDDNYKHSSRVVRLLLEHKADTNLICNGFSPLALAIASGNDMAIDELLQFGADPSLPLTHGVGSALCVASNTEYEERRSVQAREQLINKLISAGADVLAPIPIGPKRIMGTAVDYAYYMFNQDRRIAHMPYHALTHAERETYNARRQLLGHIGDIMRIKAVESEKKRIINEEKVGVRSQSASSNFVYIGAGAKVPPGVRSKGSAQAQVKFDPSKQGDQPERVDSPTRTGIIVMEGVDAKHFKNLASQQSKTPVRKPLFKYCYECGRSVGVRLVACTRCKEVYYCSKACKMKAWNARHKDECIRVGGRSRSPSPKNRGESPTSTTVAGKNKRYQGHQKINVPVKGLSKSADGQRKLAKHRFRTGSPPNYDYVFIDNYSHN